MSREAGGGAAAGGRAQNRTMELTRVTLPSSQSVMTTQPIAGKQTKQLDANAILFFASSALQLEQFSTFGARPPLSPASAHDSLAFAALHADFDLVKRMVENVAPEQRSIMLSTVSTTTTQLGRVTVERIGTPLQMTIYDADEEVVAYFKAIMDPEEFDRQSKEAFKKAISPELSASNLFEFSIA